MKVIKFIRSFLFVPFERLYRLFLLFITRISLSKLDNIGNKNIKINYKFESPILELNNLEKDYTKIISPSVTINENENKIILSFTDFLALDDRFCSFKEKINFLKRKNQILVTKTKKNKLPGHKLRKIILEKIKNDKRFEYLDLSSKKIPDLHNFYSNYKFVLVIENCDNDSYISEKYYDVIKSGAIPIYHKKKVSNFKHCYVSFDKMYDANYIFKKVLEFNKINNYEKTAQRNFKYLKKFRTDLIYNFLKYSVLPYYAFSGFIHKKTIFNKIHNLIFNHNK